MSGFISNPQFTSFKLVPQEHADYLFGDRDKDLRDDLLMSFKECAYSERGYHAIIWGDSGRGKTHLANNLLVNAEKGRFASRACLCGLPDNQIRKGNLSRLFTALCSRQSRPRL